MEFVICTEVTYSTQLQQKVGRTINSKSTATITKQAKNPKGNKMEYSKIFNSKKTGKRGTFKKYCWI